MTRNDAITVVNRLMHTEAKWPGTEDTLEALSMAVNALQTTPALRNDPLTIEQLQEMDGEPVFVVIDDGIEPLKMWALVDYIAEEQCLTLTNNLGGRSQYYTADDLEIYHITAYRRPPEGEANE